MTERKINLTECPFGRCGLSGSKKLLQIGLFASCPFYDIMVSSPVENYQRDDPHETGAKTDYL